MKWRDFGVDEWDDVPDDPPRRDHGAVTEPLTNGAVVRDRDDGDKYVYSDSPVEFVDVDDR